MGVASLVVSGHDQMLEAGPSPAPGVDPEAVSTPPAPAAAAPTRFSGRLRKGRHRARSAGEWAFVLALAIAVALLVRHFLVQSYYIPSPSMRPTLIEHDRLLVTKVNYQWGEVARGDVIVFKRPPSMQVSASEHIDDLVKRVIGLPGDTVESRDGRVYINGAPLDEPYLPAGTVTEDIKSTVVPVDEYFMMGDNRGNSFDSRYWGTIHRNEIIGKVVFRFWPPNRIGTIG